MDIHQRFLKIQEYYAAGLFEEPDRSIFYRKALGLRRYYEHLQIPEYNGKKLYPSGVRRVNMAVSIHYMNMAVEWGQLRDKDSQAAEELAKSEFFRYVSTVPQEHTVAGNMYIHSMPNYERVLAEGLDGYRQRVEAMKDREMREGLLHLLDGIRCYHDRCLAYLESVDADETLIAALKVVPFRPATNIYEAILAWNYVLYLDNCDNLGSLATGLEPYYRGEDVVELLENLYDNLDENNGYSMSLGVADSPLILQCLKASAGKRRPMIELFSDGNTREEIWNQALRNVLSGCGQPAFYNRQLYLQGFREKFPQIREADIPRMCGGGCTEMMLAGVSNVGSLDAGINLLLLLERQMHSSLETAESFEDFYRDYLESVHRTATTVMEEISNSRKNRAKYCPVPMRTLLVDDCIQAERDFNDGGPRYSWSVINYAGIVNVVDSLLVIHDLVFRNRIYTPAEFLEKLENGDPNFRKQLKNHPNRFGVDCEDANSLAASFTKTVFAYLNEGKLWKGLGFLPSSIQFMAYEEAGKHIGATPCGRMAGEPIADSLSAIFGKDTKGPTAMLKSVTAMDLSSAIGTPVVNLTVNKDCDPEVLKGLIRGYLQLGGMQLQITCQSREELLAAYENPENYKNLVVRVGGYSEYFYRLSDELKKKVLERTYHL